MKKPPQKIDLEVPPFYEMFPLTLLHKEGKTDKICYFMCKEHLQSYITRNKLKKNQVTIKKTEGNYHGT